MKEPLLSVCLITYNHKAYIKQAIDSVLAQQVNFEYEFIIADDCSTDGTTEIVKNYQSKHCDKIKLILQEKNVGAANNWLDLLAAPKGKYIAYFEGDDYWTDPNKLQKQVDFLEANPDYSICFHAVNTLSNGLEKPAALNLSKSEETYSILDLANECIIHTLSIVYRNGMYEKFPDWIKESPVGDYVLHLLNAKKGFIKYLPEVMAVYRVHSAGAWGQYNIGVNHPKSLWILNKLLNEDFDEAVLVRLAAQKNRVFNEYIEWLLKEKKYDLVTESYTRFYNEADVPDTTLLLDSLVKALNNLNNEVASIKGRKLYKVGSKMADFKYKYTQLLQKK